MDRRVTEFVRGLRAAGVRVSVAEALDGLRALSAVDVADRDVFRRALRATLVKKRSDREAFEALFPLYFSGGEPPLRNALEELDPDDEALLRSALEALAGRARRLLEWLTSGDGPSREALEELARRAARMRSDPRNARLVSRRLLEQLGFGDLDALLSDLRAQLEAAGMGDEAIAALMGIVDANRDSIEEGLARQIGREIARQQAERPDGGTGDLMDTPLQGMSHQEMTVVRQEVARLVARLRSRAALRQKRSRRGRPDLRRAIRSNLRYGGIPLVLPRRRRRMKPSLAVIVDVSTSMRPVAELMLRLIYELSDQVARARSFAFNDDLVEITHLIEGRPPSDAVAEVLYAIPPGYYATDLGRSLETFTDHFRGAVDRRTTLIVLGDGRNNYNPARAELLKDLQRRSRRLIWLNPESERRWGTDDSDMLEYAPICDAVYPVRTLGQLTAAVDRLLADG